MGDVIQFPVKKREPEVIYTADFLYMTIPCDIVKTDGYERVEMLYLPPPTGEPMGFYHYEPIGGNLWPSCLFWLGRGEPELFTPKTPKEFV
jgi:hypothetical protein